MIGIQGQSLLLFTIDQQKDFLTIEDFESLTLIEEAGNILPTFECVFKTTKEDLLRYINEGNPFNISLGRDSNKMTTSIFSILSKVISKSGGNSYHITIKGILTPMSYVNNESIAIFPNMSSVSAIKQVVSKSFVPEFNIESAPDSQSWYQYNITDKAFVNNTWMHSYLPNTFIALGITTDHKFRLYDIRKSISSDAKWKFTTDQVKAENEVNYQVLEPLKSDTGFINSWAGYSRLSQVFDIDSGEFTDTTIDSFTMMALSNTLDRSSDMSAKQGRLNIQNKNMHAHYYAARYQNLMNLAVYSSTSIVVEFSDKYLPIKVLDDVMLINKEINSRDNSQAEDSHSGKYLVSKVVRNYSSNSVITTVFLNREAITGITGSLK